MLLLTISSSSGTNLTNKEAWLTICIKNVSCCVTTRNANCHAYIRRHPRADHIFPVKSYAGCRNLSFLPLWSQGLTCSREGDSRQFYSVGCVRTKCVAVNDDCRIREICFYCCMSEHICITCIFNIFTKQPSYVTSRTPEIVLAATQTARNA